MSYTQHLARPVLNIAPIEIPDTAIQVDVFAYDPTTGHETLDQLRRTYRGTHAVARRGAHIVCLPRIQSAPAVGGAQEALPLHENLGMVAALLREPSSITSTANIGQSSVTVTTVSRAENCPTRGQGSTASKSSHRASK